MQTSYKPYYFNSSLQRIDEILNQSNDQYKEVKRIPSESQLTYTNGFYVKATSLFIDLRDSTNLSEKHTRPVLAKIYRSFISEVIAIINGNRNCKYIHIDGDCVSGVYDTLDKNDIGSVFDDAAKINSLISVLSCKFEKKGYSGIQAGIGIDYGRLLFIKTGYNGSGLNDVAWMGQALNIASKLAGKGRKDFYEPILMTENIYKNLSDEYKSFCEEKYEFSIGSIYQSNAVNISMIKWLEENCNE